MDSVRIIFNMHYLQNILKYCFVIKIYLCNMLKDYFIAKWSLRNFCKYCFYIIGYFSTFRKRYFDIIQCL